MEKVKKTLQITDICYGPCRWQLILFTSIILESPPVPTVSPGRTWGPYS